MKQSLKEKKVKKILIIHVINGYLDSHPASANAIVAGENAVEAVACGPP